MMDDGDAEGWVAGRGWIIAGCLMGTMCVAPMMDALEALASPQ